MRQNKYIEKTKTYAGRALGFLSSVFNKSASVNIGKRRINFYPAKVAAAIIVVAILLSLILSSFSVVGGKKNVNISFDTGHEYSTRMMNEKVLVYNNSGVKAIRSDGKVDWEIKEALSSPLVEVGGDYVLLTDLAGNHFAASYKDGKKKQDFQLGNDIISAKITKSGYTVFATDTDGYKGRVSVFNKRGKEIYSWNSGSGYISDIEISDNGRYLVVAQLVSDGSCADTRLQFIDTRRGEVIASAERPGEITVNMNFVSSNKLIVVTDNHILGYTTRGKEKFSISLIGKTPSLYNIETDDTIGVVTLDKRGNSVLELYSVSGRLRGSYTASGDIRAIAISEKSAVVAQQRGLTRVSARGKEKSIIGVEHDIKDIGYFGRDKRVLAVGAAQAETISIK